MFGYVRPLKGLLRVCEHETYKAAYCGLCHALGRRYGWPARFILRYDFVFLALALSAYPLECTRRRCLVSPFVRKMCCRGGDAFDLSADIHVLLTYGKLRDTAKDEKWAVAARLGSWLMKGAYRKAAARQPVLAACFAEKLQRLSAYEERREASLDKPADAFACMLAEAAFTAEEESQRRILHQLFYHVGRWVYLIDACDDLAGDAQTGAYNPVAARFGLADGQWTDAAKDDMRITMRLSRQRAYAALALFDRSDPILENIVTYGLPWVEDQVFSGAYGKRAKKKYE